MTRYSLQAYIEAAAIAIGSGAWTYLMLTIVDAAVR